MIALNRERLCMAVAKARADRLEYTAMLAPTELGVWLVRQAMDPNLQADVDQVLAVLSEYGQHTAEQLIAGEEVER